jgi:hypothetical protein
MAARLFGQPRFCVHAAEHLTREDSFMPTSPEFLRALAEAAAPLARELAVRIVERPLPAAGQSPFSLSALEALCRELDELLAEAVPALEGMAADMDECDLVDVDELFDDLAPPAFDCLDMAHRIWEAPLPREAESLRPLLAALAEEPAARLLDLLLRILHAVIDPWAVLDQPDNPVFSFALAQGQERQRAALTAWRRSNPGILPEDILA